MLDVGTQAPGFTLVDQDDTPVSLDDLRGSWVALWWYPKASTRGCTIEGCAYRDAAGDFEAANARILGISYDVPVDQKAFVDEHGFPYPLLSDADRKVSGVYGAVRPADDPLADKGYPRRISYLIDPDGRIAKSYVLDGSPELDQHPSHVLDDIRALEAQRDGG